MTPRHGGTSGAAMAELVVLAPLLLLLLLGLVEAGRAGDLAITVASAARAGVQYGSQNHTTAADTTGIQSAATNDANNANVTAVAACAGGSPDPLQAQVSNQSWGMTPSALTVTTTCPGGNTGCTSAAAPFNGAGCLVTVTVAYSFHFITPLISIVVLPMSSQSQMVISQ